MYQIHKDVKCPLNIVTPHSVKKYQEYLTEQGNEAQEGITAIAMKKVSEAIKDGGIKESSILNIVGEAITSNAVESLAIYTDRKFIDDWTEIIFVITPEEIEKTKENWDMKFSWDEFMRGFFDFFLRLREPSKKATS